MTMSESGRWIIFVVNLLLL